ncbi:hypothetical protein KAS31_01610 [Candidatus Parcubacteria bacterium]|nr:hypothetical protein [Candidatus Parcubacteria bacterium]
MKLKSERVRGEIVELADESEAQTWDTVHKRTFHGIVDTIEEAEHWVEKVYNCDPGETLYAVEGEEIFFDVKEKITTVETKATARRNES